MMVRVGICLAFVSCASWGSPASGQDSQKSNAADQADREVSGIVTDSAGLPVGDATVWLVGNGYEEPNEPRDRTRTDAKGRFAFEGAVIEGIFDDLIRRRFVLARDASKRLGWSNRLSRGHASTVRIELREVAATRASPRGVLLPALSGSKRPRYINPAPPAVSTPTRAAPARPMLVVSTLNSHTPVAARARPRSRRSVTIHGPGFGSRVASAGNAATVR